MPFSFSATSSLFLRQCYDSHTCAFAVWKRYSANFVRRNRRESNPVPPEYEGILTTAPRPSWRSCDEPASKPVRFVSVSLSTLLFFTWKFRNTAANFVLYRNVAAQTLPEWWVPLRHLESKLKLLLLIFPCVCALDVVGLYISDYSFVVKYNWLPTFLLYDTDHVENDASKNPSLPLALLYRVVT
jgi:hypothetical protein